MPGLAKMRDECFNLLGRSRSALPSLELEGFRFHRPDLGLQPELNGESGNAANCNFRHHGRGNQGPGFI
jgi:hypothetical protein